MRYLHKDGVILRRDDKEDDLKKKVRLNTCIREVYKRFYGDTVSSKRTGRIKFNGETESGRKK